MGLAWVQLDTKGKKVLAVRGPCAEQVALQSSPMGVLPFCPTLHFSCLVSMAALA